MRVTSRLFQSIPLPVDWKKKLISSISPLLIFFEKEGVCSLVDPRYGDKYLINLPPSLSGCDICYSNNGWLLLSGNMPSTFLFNPFTTQILPFLKQTYVPVGRFPSYMAFSSYPTSPVLLFEIKQWPWKVGLNYTRLEGKRWDSG
ncbi:hypothetical protein CRYUN_Cryun38cG0065500 [Craigia yunnanensis]